jgi:TRAF3-interacting protein 1
LEKMVKLVGMQLNTIIEARPAKIVSGLEPNNTNRLLQLLAVAASSVPDSARAVQAVLTSEEAGNGDVPTSVKSKPTEITSHTPLQETTEAKPRTTGAKEGEGDKNVELVFQDAVARTSGPPQSKDPRPTTARRRPPKYKAKNANDEQEGLKANENSLNVKQAIMIDNEDDGAADDENEDMSGGGSAINTGDILTMDGKSKLVRQIQEEERSATKAGEKEGNTKEGIRFGRIDHAVATCKSKLPEANFLELQHSIQILCQSTNPLGKCMDFVHEDLFAMMKEYDKWKHDYKKCILDLEMEFRETKEVTKPLEVKLREFDDKVLDAQRCMRSIKARVLKQEERITKLLRVSSVSTLQE